MTDAPGRVWLSETTDEIASEYGAHGRSLGDRPEVEYVRADLYATLERKLNELRETLERVSDALYVAENATFTQDIASSALADK